jgi:fibrillarin-like rRNA methylase
MTYVMTYPYAICTHLSSPHPIFFMQASCIDSTAEPAAVFAAEVNKMKTEKMKPKEQLTLEPFERDHAVVVGEYRCVLNVKKPSSKYS